jgi:uncharacterized protein (TIGR04551 family)
MTRGLSLCVLFVAAPGFAQEADQPAEPAKAEAVAGDAAAEAAPAEANEESPKEAEAAAPKAAAAKPAQDAIDLERLKSELKLELLEELSAGRSQGAGVPADWEEKTLKESIKPALRTLELKGYFRTRMDYMRNLDLGTAQFNRTRGGWDGSSNVPPALFWDGDSVSELSSANMRLRLDPTLNLSETVQIHSRVDVFDNVMMGATPDSFPGLIDNPSSPLSLFSASSNPPQAGVNGPWSSLVVKRVYGDVLLPVGRLRFGRMGSNFGLGLLSNGGDADQADSGDNADRIMFLTKLSGHIVGLGWDFAAEGPFGAGGGNGAAQPYRAGEGRQFYDLAQRDDVEQYVAVVAKADRGEALKRLLSEGKTSTNYGAYVVYRTQAKDFPTEWYGSNYQGSFPIQVPTEDGGREPLGAVSRDAQATIASLWFRRQNNRYRVEAEAVTIQGSVGSFATKAEDIGNPAVEDIEISQLGVALESEYKLAKDKLTVGLNAGYASGDDYPRWGLRPGTGQVAAGDRETGDTRQFGCPVASETNTANPCSAALDKTISNFRFDPSYRVDQILFREVIGGVTDAWYVKPHVAYALNSSAQIKAAAIYGQAVHAQSTPGGETPLGLEFDLGLDLKLKNRLGFALDYALLFPMAGLNYVIPQGSTVTASTAQRVMGTLMLRF